MSSTFIFNTITLVVEEMGALAAVFNVEGEAIPRVADMLMEMVHRGTDIHGLGTMENVLFSKSIREFKFLEVKSNVALGYNFSRLFPRDIPQPIQEKDFTLIFHGRIFPSPKISETEAVKERLKPHPKLGAEQIIRDLDGAYTFTIAFKDKLIAGRDALGLSPLYYGEGKGIYALASEKKALWKIGMRNVKSFPPGNLALITEKGFKFQPIKTLSRPPLRALEMEGATRILERLLEESVKERLCDVDRVALAFSGGLDCGVIAKLAKECGVEVQLIHASLEGQLEAEHAEKAAEVLGLPLKIQTYTTRDVEQALPRVLWLIEKADPMSVSIGIPFNWTAETASKMGFNVLLAGQGGDELFGGYQRYLREYALFGAEAVEEALFHDVKFCYKVNFERDEKVCSYHKVELRLPYVDREVVDFALSLPLQLKIISKEDTLRKRVLRNLAHNLGIPPLIANRPKKAIQYASGVNKAIQKLARKEGLTPKGYVEKIFRRIFMKEADTN